MHTNSRQISHLLLLSAIVLAVFGNSLLNGFVWDDHSVVVDNVVYKGFDLGRIFFSRANGLEYLPLRDLAYAVDFALWGGKASGFHFTSLLLFLANVIFVYLLTAETVRLVDSSGEGNDAGLIPFFTALFFAVHPIQSQAVNFITCRNVLLSGLFFFLSSFLYLKFLQVRRSPRAVYYIGALLCFLCALLSKATAIILPLALLLFTAFDSRGKRWKNLSYLVPFFALSLVFFFLFKEVGSQTGIIADNRLGYGVSALQVKIATALQIPFFYLRKLIVPAGFSAEYDVSFAGSLVAPVVIAALAALFGLFFSAIAARKRYPWLLFGLGWFMLTLVPVLNFFSTKPVVADRYAFLPSFGIFFIAATWLVRQANGRYRRWVLFGGVLLAFIWSGSAISRNTVWKDDRSLWEDAVRATPGQIKAYTNLGWVYFHAGEYDRAFAIFAREQELAPHDSNYELARGYLHFKRKEWRAAVGWLEKALAKKGDSLYALYLAGKSYENLGEYERAADAFTRILASTEPDFSGYRETARNNLEWLKRVRQVAPNPGR